jgi:hypothetical protein
MGGAPRKLVEDVIKSVEVSTMTPLSSPKNTGSKPVKIESKTTTTVTPVAESPADVSK